MYTQLLKINTPLSILSADNLSRPPSITHYNDSVLLVLTYLSLLYSKGYGFVRVTMGREWSIIVGLAEAFQ